jgi:acetyl esterase/lipase
MVHGGGHFLYSRRDMPMKHVRVLLQRGFLPVSVDYRLCPELGLIEGPVTDVCDALQWARETLPFLPLGGPAVKVDADRVLALGWSSGGHLAMTLGYTPQLRGVKPPDVILPFYSPTDLEAERKFFQLPSRGTIVQLRLLTNFLATQTGTSPFTQRRQRRSQERSGGYLMACATNL